MSDTTTPYPPHRAEAHAGADAHAGSDPGATARPPRRRRRVVLLTIAAITVVVALVAVAAVTLFRPAAPAAPAAAPATVPVTTGDMVSATNARGTLHFAQERPVPAGAAGVLTGLPEAGSVIAPGGVLYRVDTRPVLLLRGSQPAWRPLELGMTDGDDVRQLEENLVALGVPFTGDVDTRFTQATATAIGSWQKSLGVERTGRFDRASIVFSDHDLRVARLTASIGADIAPGAELYRVSATDKVVDLDLALTDQQLAVVGATVGVTLPDGTVTTGSIAAVSEPRERTDDATSTTSAQPGTPAKYVIPVTIALADQVATSAFPRASVSVQFSSTLAAGVLTVPVEALIATAAGSFGVQTPDAGSVRTIPVTTGAFGSGRVQISGDGIRDGLDVVVPAS